MNVTSSSSRNWEFSTIFWLSLVLIAVNVFTIIANVLVIVIVLANHRLRRSTNYLVVNLSVADMLFSCTSYPFVIGSIINQNTTANNALCIFVGFSDSFYATSASFSVAIIAYERYYSIIHCLHYEQSVMNRKTKLVIASVWIASFLISLAPLLNWGMYRFERTQFKCTLAFQFDKGYFVFRLLVAFLIPLSAMFICYNWIFMVARRHANSISNIEIRVQNNLIQRNNLSTKHHTGAVFITVVVYIICWLPINTLYLTKNLRPTITIPTPLLTASCILSLLSSTINPVVYALVTGKFRKGFIRLCNKLTSQKNRVVPAAKRTSPGTWTVSSVRFSRRGSTSHTKFLHRSDNNIDKATELEGNSTAKQSGILLEVQTLEKDLRLSPSPIEKNSNFSLSVANRIPEQ